jgi:hypothetical protein
LFHGDNAKFFTEIPVDKDHPPIDPNCDTNYILNKDTCISSFDIDLPIIGPIHIPIGNLEPAFMSFLNRIYTKDQFKIVNTEYDTALDNDYDILYNKIPLKSSTVANDSDETYTYLSGTKVGANNNARILGLKNDSKFVDLTNAGDKRINDLLNDENTSKDIEAGFYPIVVNAYAQHKYHLKVGDTIEFNINNTADRITKQINGETDSKTEKFKVVGFNTTYQGEEYFTNQQLANSILGLRSELTEKYPDKFNCNLHNYYFNSEKTDV